jgi:formamidopyrimidine-DNA glycosylase
MKMTGHLLYGNYGFSKTKNGEIWKAVGDKNLEDPYNQFIHLVFSLSNGKSLAFSDLRKFAKVIFFETPKNGQATHLLPLGPEPFETSLSDFKKQIVKKPNLKIKQALMDQSVIAGIGNIYSDEILWAANVHPQRQIKSLSDKEISAIQKEMKIVLKKSIKMGGDSMSDYRNIHGERGRFQNSHKAYRKTGEKCPKPGCLGKIIRLKIGGRSAHFCEKHQK